MQEYTYHPTEERVLIKKQYNADGSNKDTTYYVSKDLVRIVNSSGSYDITYIYHEGQLIAERDNDGNKRYYMPDHLGSTSLVTDSSGVAIENTSYAPFGEILSGGDASRYQYEGKEFDSTTGQYDFHFRGYKNEWGKFTQPDSLLPNVYDPQQLNRYAFERNSPWMYTDESGHDYTANAGDAAGVTNLYFGLIFVNPSERKRINEQRKYEALYTEYQSENPSLPKDPYIKTLHRGAFGKTYTAPERRTSLTSLEQWKNEKDGLGSKKEKKEDLTDPDKKKKKDKDNPFLQAWLNIVQQADSASQYVGSITGGNQLGDSDFGSNQGGGTGTGGGGDSDDSEQNCFTKCYKDLGCITVCG